jgi:hypothetical protein
MKKFKVIQAHKPSDPDNLTGISGDKLAFERRPSKYKGWLWCRSTNGNESWVPEAWLRIEGKQAVLLRDYTANELNIEVGELATLVLVQSEWAYCQSEKGTFGWLPLSCIEEGGG